MKRAWLFCCALMLSAPTDAGHGLINSFAGIEWLPRPGTTPQSPWYRLELWRDELNLDRVDNLAERWALLHHLTRERLAELEACVRSTNCATDRTLATYQAYLARWQSTVEDFPSAERSTRVASLLSTLLEHQYIVATDFYELPRATRSALFKVREIASKPYAELRATLSRKIQDSLFFREEEVRWSWEQANGTQEQGL